MYQFFKSCIVLSGTTDTLSASFPIWNIRIWQQMPWNFVIHCLQETLDRFPQEIYSTLLAILFST